MKIRSSFNKMAMVAMLCGILFAANAMAEDEDELFDLNDVVVKTEMYVWNRVSDLLDLFRVGLAGGADLGVDMQVTKFVQLGAMITNERGVDFPHLIPPLWMVHYYQHKQIFRTHEGYCGTLAFGPFRKDWVNVEDTKPYFDRPDWDIRLEVAAIAHIYVDISLPEIGDFFVGIVGWDPQNDDQEIDPSMRRRPADQFGRGICNILFGVAEIPANILRVTDEEGDLAGVSKGVGLGVWRFLVREVVGVVELVTFPFGWTPIIEPEYPIQKTKNTVWNVKRPAFHKRY